MFLRVTRVARLPLKINTTYYFLPITYCFKYAGVAELADALDLGSSVFDVQVQVLSPAPIFEGRPMSLPSLFYVKR